MNLRDYTDFQPSVFKRTPEGYLTGKIRVTSAGVYPYIVDGGVSKRLRPIEQVGAPESIASLNNKPVTLRHPVEDVSPDNAGKLTVGFTGNDASWDGINAYVTMTITHKDAIEACERGDVRAVSCGYSASLLPDSGVWCGSSYDEVMENIVYNHVALVKEGRAGDGVRFKIGDSAEGERIFTNNAAESGKDGKMKKMILDGVEYEADEKIIDHLQSVSKQLDEAKAQNKAIEDEKASITAARDAALADVEKMKASQKDEAEIAKMVDEKVALLDQAKGFGVEVKAADSVADIKTAVIKKAYPEMELAEKPQAYLDCAFDLAAKKLSEKPAEKQSSLAPDMSKLGDEMDTEKAYQAMCENLNKINKEA